MPISLLAESPLGFVAWVAAIIIALTVHEFMHALASTYLGDPTAEREGRLTLNPLAHVDWFGFFALLFVGFGWGKPVPYNPYNLKYHRWGGAIVAMAGPASNLLMAFLSALALRLVSAYTNLPPANLLIQFLFLLLGINVVLMCFNLIPVPPLDGSKLLFAVLDSRKYDNLKYNLETRGPIILLTIIILDNFLGVGILSGLFGFAMNLVYTLAGV